MELLSKIRDVNPVVTRIMMSAFEIQDELFQEYKCVDKFLQKLINEVRLLITNTKTKQKSEILAREF